MSDPVTNVDVEDVLSSIRRLVSDTNSDDRQEINVSEVAETKEEKTSKSEAKPADALLLTSALRVDTPDADSVPEFRHADLKNFRSTLSGEKPAEEEKPSAPQARWTPLANDEYYEDVEQQESAPVIDFIRHGGKVVKQQDAEPIAAEEDIWATGAEPQAESDEAELKAEAIFKTQNVDKNSEC
ncbi:hypothetical protein GQR58_030585 [Nymphon striatum]|nr:hypothetical protein GQR58_030585 [Nymphon striatum]